MRLTAFGLKRQDGNLSTYQVHDIFLVWGGDAPNPFRNIPFYSISLHSAGLPGRVKMNPNNALLFGFIFTGCNWKPYYTLNHQAGNRVMIGNTKLESALCLERSSR
jgi:hypothetical protein